MRRLVTATTTPMRVMISSLGQDECVESSDCGDSVGAAWHVSMVVQRVRAIGSADGILG